MLKRHAQGSAAQAFAPAARLDENAQELRLIIAGAWTVRQIGAIESALKVLRLPSSTARTPRAGGGQAALILDLAGLAELDTAGAWMLCQIITRIEKLGLTPRIEGASGDELDLIDEVRRSAFASPPPEPSRIGIAQLSAQMLRGLAGFGNDVVDLTGFLGAVTATAMRALVQPWRFRWVAFVHHLEHVGLRAIPIISLICALIGAVIMQQGVVQLRRFGAETFAVNMLGVLTLREIGILLTVIMVAGRSASAFTAEIGTMKMREEVDAMRTIGIDPLETLVLPRMLALLVALPLLTLWGDLMCFVGGGVMAQIYLGLDTPLYIEKLHDAIVVRHFFVGLVKAPFAALVVGLVGCLEGMRVRGSAESLGVHVTAAVVKAIFLVIVLDAVFAIFLSAVGY